MRILLQFPEGLKKLAFEEARALEKKGHEVLVSSSPCFGACDLALEEAKAVGAHKIIHWGHSDFGVRSRIPVEYREYPMNVEVKEIIEEAIGRLGENRMIGLITTVQHAKQIPEIKRELLKAGKKAILGKGLRTKYPGQVLGCDSWAAKSIEAKVDCFLYFGGGLFHPLIEAKKPVLRADPFSGEVKWIDEEMRLAKRRRNAGMASLVSARTVGILISTKPGQKNIKRAEKAKEKLEKSGKECMLLVSNFIDFSSLRNFGPIDCYVNTAGPRLSDDSEAAGKPIINFHDAIEVAKMLVKHHD
jgi:2-(3-amino-3-carboxypropyl)histidine synthase